MAAIFTPGFTFAVGTTYGNNVVGDVDMATFISAMSITSVGETGATFAQSAIGNGATNNGITGNAGTSIAALRRLATDGAAVTSDMALGAGDPRVGRAEKFKTSGSDVNLSTTPPTVGKVIIATSATAAEWGTVNASAINGTGKVDITTDVNFVEHALGTFPTNFLSELKVGYLVQVGTQIRRIVTIASDTAATVDSAWDSTLTDQTFTFFISSQPRPFNLTLAKTNADTPVSVQVADAGTTFTADTTAGNVVFNLPAVGTVPDGSTFTFKKISDDVNQMDVTPNGADIIDGVNATITYKTVNAFITLQVDGVSSVWRIVGQDRAPGQVLQRVVITNSARAFGNGVVSEGSFGSTEGNLWSAMDAAITPKSAVTTLAITTNVQISCTSTSGKMVVGLFQDAGATSIDNAWALPGGNGGGQRVGFVHQLTSGATTATTFKLRYGSTTAGTAVNGNSLTSSQPFGASSSSIIVEEIAI